jgi:tetratricopeptide (TPR) repeat protein
VWDGALARAASTAAAGRDDSTRLADTFLPVIHAARGELSALEPWLARASKPSEWHELDLVESVARAVALRAHGRLEEAASVMVVAAPELANSFSLTGAFYLDEVFDTLLDAGDHEFVERLLAVREPHSVSAVYARHQRARGLLFAARGRLDEAEAALSRAATTLGSVGNPFALGRALLDDGAVLGELGRTGEAAAALEQAKALFAQLRASPWLDRADETLAAPAPVR